MAIHTTTRQCLDRRIGGIDELREELDAWQESYNADPSPVDWRFTAEDGRVKLKRLYPDCEGLRKANDERREEKLQKLRRLAGNSEG